jgi:hypothetical protein
MKLHSKKFSLQGKGNSGKKILSGIGLSLALGTGLSAQTTSYVLNSTPIVGASCSGFGVGSLIANTTGQFNAGNGINALRNNTTGNFNTGSGGNALFTNTTGRNNTATGAAALGLNTTASDNTADGAFALRFNTTGTQNTAAGAWALTANTTANQNTSVGMESMFNTTTGSFNTALGYRALYSNVNGVSNTACGLASMFSNTGGFNNSAYGYNSLSNNLTGNNNTSIGLQSLYNTNNDNNSGLGFQALFNNTTGTGNTGLGALADVGAPGLTNATAVGFGAVVNASNRVWLGNAINDVWAGIGAGFLMAPSDQRFKYNVEESDVKGLEFIQLLRPVSYNFDARKFTEHTTKHMSAEVREKHLSENFDKASAVRQSGFLAQEVEAAAKKCGYKFDGVHVPESDIDTYGLSYAEFVVPLVKAVQEQQKMIQEQKQQLEEQKQLISELAKKSGISTGISQPGSTLNGFSMDQNEPNPFTNETVISYNIPQQVNNAYLAVYDLSGKQITTFPIEQKGASSMTITSEKLSAGIYIYSIIGDNKVMDSKKMIVAGK